MHPQDVQIQVTASASKIGIPSPCRSSGWQIPFVHTLLSIPRLKYGRRRKTFRGSVDDELRDKQIF